MLTECLFILRAEDPPLETSGAGGEAEPVVAEWWSERLPNTEPTETCGQRRLLTP